MHNNSEYTEEQFRATLEKIQTQPKKVYTEDSVDNARANLRQVEARLQQLEADYLNAQRNLFSYRHTDIRDKVNQAKQDVMAAQAELDDAIKNASGLAARKRERAIAAQREEERAQAQATYAEEVHLAWATDAREKFLAAGGTPYEFELAQENLWQHELARRVQVEQDANRVRLNVRAAF